MKFTVLGHRFAFFHKKVRESYGLCSKLKNGKHILLFDIDELAEGVKDRDIDVYIRGAYPRSAYSRVPTKAGWHVIVWKEYELRDAACELLFCLFSDPVYVGLGLKRGWWFLERNEIFVPDEFKDKIRFLMVERDGNKK